jgi:aryl-alcohol dehydrogenase-like predicted oxidoreductase
MKHHTESRRAFIKTSAAVATGMILMPGFGFVPNRVSKPLKRSFGKLNFEVTTMGLGGQASIQWTPDDVDPVKIIMKAFNIGVNYFDTSNVYGPSQLNYGKAFNELSLNPSRAGYKESLRRSIFLTTKTHLRYAKGGVNTPGVSSRTNGAEGSFTVDDVKRSLSQMFGDNQGNYPAGVYLDMVLIHNLNTMEEVDALYEGLYDSSPKAERIGALAALRDYRDGTNLTGLNPKQEKLIRHIGFSGHFSPPVMVEMIQRDKTNLLDAMLIAINANDRLNFNMQHNVIPIAAAKNMGVIGMKVFADGAMYTKEAHWTRGPAEVVRSIGSQFLPSRSLIEYTLTTPGVHTAIIGIGQISDDPLQCQLEQNLSASQISITGMNATDRVEVEKMTRVVKAGKTNYFQLEDKGLTPPANVSAKQKKTGDELFVELKWDTAFAGNMPLKSYEIWRDGNILSTVNHKPQISKIHFTFNDKLTGGGSHEYMVVATDMAGRAAKSETLRVGEM